MVRGELFLRAALVALDETNDPTRIRATIADALATPAPPHHVAKPAGTLRRVAWLAEQLAMCADDAARAYANLRVLVGVMFEPLAGTRRVAAPAPEVALTLSPDELLDALAPPARVMARELAIAAKANADANARFDIDALLASRRATDRVLGIRSIATAALGRYADAVAARIVDVDEVVRVEAIEVCSHATGKARAKIAAALAQLAGISDDSSARDSSTRDSSTRDSSTRDSSTRDSSTRDSSTRDSSTRDSSTRDSSTRDSSTRNSSTRDSSTRDSSIDIPRADIPRVDIPRADIPRVDIPRVDIPRVDIPRVDIPRADIPPVDIPRADIPRVDIPRVDIPRVDIPRVDIPRVDIPRAEIPRTEIPRTEIPPADLPRASADLRAAALDGLRALKLPLADARLAACLRDSAPQVRAAAARSVLTTCLPDVGAALLTCLADDDAHVRAATLDAVARCSTLHRPSLVAPLQALVQRHDGDTRAAVYLLGKLHEADRDGVIATLRACEHGPRSDVARAATLVLGQMKVPASEVPVEVRMLRAARELASTEKETQLAGLFEAARLGEAARPLVPAIKRLGEEVVAADVLAKVQDVLGGLGVPPAELPKARAVLAPWRGIAPRERAVHGAYAVATVRELGIGLWDRATGKMLFVVEGAELLEMVPGRAEVGVVRVTDDEWCFERYAVPSGERVGALAIPEALAYGWPSSLAMAGGLVTVWCGDEDAPYRFHIKLGDPDRLLDDEPSLGKRGRGRKRERGGQQRPPRST